MKHERTLLVLSLVVAALLGFGLGWWLRDHTGDSIEHRARAAAEHMREAVRSVTH